MAPKRRRETAALDGRESFPEGWGPALDRLRSDPAAEAAWSARGVTDTFDYDEADDPC